MSNFSICELGYCPYSDDDEMECDFCPYYVECDLDSFVRCLTSFLNRIMQKILVAPGAISAANRAIYFSVSTRFCALCGRNTHLEILMLLPLFSPRPVGP